MKSYGGVGLVLAVAVALGSACASSVATEAGSDADGGAPAFTADASSDAPVSFVDATSPASDAAANADASGPVTLALTVPCADTVSDVYVTPAGMPAFNASARGAVVRCAHDTDLALADVQAELTAKNVKTPATSGVHVYRVAYRTTRGNGAGGVSSARLYVPDAPRALPLPVIVVAHATTGLASSCAPSKDPSSMEDEALPWASQGFAVIAPDFAGLGNDDTVQGYVDNHDTGYSLLDGARALRNVFAPAALRDEVLAVGWSQGGGAVLSAQALASSYGAGGTLVGVIAFAPEWPTRDNSFGYVDMLKSPDSLTITTGISNPVVAALRQYAYFSAYQGTGHATDWFPAAGRSGFQTAVTSLCQTPFGGYLQGACTHVGDLFDPTFRAALLACVSGSAGCVEPAKSYYAFMQQNVLTANPTGAKVLFIQGIADTIMPAASEAACNIDKLERDGVTPQVCTDLLAIHTDVVPRNVDFALTWGEAILGGTSLPACPQTLGMPTCTP